MATINEIIQVRLAVNDPDVIAIIQVAAAANLPTSPEPQTAYYTTATARYYITNITEDAELSDYEYAELSISDARISTLIDSVGVELSVCRVLTIIAGTLGNKLRLIRTTSGSESADYADISKLYKYYKDRADDCKNQYASDNYNNTGTMRQMLQPEIGGDNL